MRWAGQIGYARNVEMKPGIWDDVITEVDALGELAMTTSGLSGDSVLPQSTVTTSISVVTDGRRIPLHGMKYITYGGVRWQISSAVHQPPRFVIYLGEEYRGPLASNAAGNS